MAQVKARCSRIMLAAVLLSTLPSLAVGTAHADANSYLREVHNTVRVRLRDNQALQLGHEACHVLRKGPDGRTIPESRGEAAQVVSRAARKLGVNRHDGLDRGSVSRLVDSAERYLC
ncbi:DUF732 domain-containing protein [Mycobacterium sp. UM_WGJ]|uniref:DUF732 domain-containing protein n=1 Tax=Mycobacterium sp. UM_WGJ TaxID=1370120 RepID=UPI0012DE509F|nr:DUF732 domain-containing protein [Mycobacterium sp. UM_WGJ]